MPQKSSTDSLAASRTLPLCHPRRFLWRHPLLPEQSDLSRTSDWRSSSHDNEGTTQFYSPTPLSYNSTLTSSEYAKPGCPLGRARYGDHGSLANLETASQGGRNLRLSHRSLRTRESWHLSARWKLRKYSVKPMAMVGWWKELSSCSCDGRRMPREYRRHCCRRGGGRGRPSRCPWFRSEIWCCGFRVRVGVGDSGASCSYRFDDGA
jgi:hypothetical protein